MLSNCISMCALMPMLLCLACAVLFCPALLCLSVHLDLVWDTSFPFQHSYACCFRHSQVSNANTTPQLSLLIWCRYNTGKVTQHRACWLSELHDNQPQLSEPIPADLIFFYVFYIMNLFVLPLQSLSHVGTRNNGIFVKYDQ
jgi:hypothetical protein